MDDELSQQNIPHVIKDSATSEKNDTFVDDAHHHIKFLTHNLLHKNDIRVSHFKCKCINSVHAVELFSNKYFPRKANNSLIIATSTSVC